MDKSDISVTFEIEPIVKSKCIAKSCRYHLHAMGFDGCNFKLMSLNDRGECYYYDESEWEHASQVTDIKEKGTLGK